jgi:hypothetical protein
VMVTINGKMYNSDSKGNGWGLIDM